MYWTFIFFVEAREGSVIPFVKPVPIPPQLTVLLGGGVVSELTGVPEGGLSSPELFVSFSPLKALYNF